MTSHTTRPTTRSRPGVYRHGRSTSRFDRPVTREHRLVEARAILSGFVEAVAATTADEVGFSWRPDGHAPDRYDALLAAYERSIRTGESMPVSDQFCDSTVYTDPKVNMAFRFWHDVSHVRRGLSFELVDELELAEWHLSELERAGQSAWSLPYRLLRADLVGQVYVMALVHRFPIDQHMFVIDCIEHGLDAGILRECRRSAGPSAAGTREADEHVQP